MMEYRQYNEIQFRTYASADAIHKTVDGRNNVLYSWFE